jgi:hypothetical protein
LPAVRSRGRIEIDIAGARIRVEDRLSGHKSSLNSNYACVCLMDRNVYKVH